ncbi:YidB family protein [Silvibacterium dinghuense]|uniref:DUF937 domain-containing protein n=1 Tax=Silvibacterium dinghuense TaxID=1560006 RepID=A0A4Q1SI87_9BACT|nr:YidB family protein [Silvibacterium dinghuense]RXS97296.1 DUF937 domain-containing protein [Silvibacterium dinghuense]GGG97869.1 hypothetical protein GCM10011586_11470 [Silvibacterium dinghuense]
MGFFDALKSVTESYTGNGDHAAVTSSLLEVVQNNGGVGSLLQTLQQNGAGGLVSQWAGGQTQSADPSAIENSLGNSGIIDTIAQKTGIAPDTVKSSLATVLPLLVHHATSNGVVTEDGQPAANSGSADPAAMLQSVLGKLL